MFLVCGAAGIVVRRPTAVEKSHQSPRLRSAVIQTNSPVVPAGSETLLTDGCEDPHGELLLLATALCSARVGESGVGAVAPESRRMIGRTVDSGPLPVTSRLLSIPQRVPSRDTSLYLDTRFHAGGLFP